jgi:hypothetical protein
VPNVSITTTVDTVMTEFEIAQFEEDAKFSDWARVTLIGLSGVGEVASGGLNGVEIKITSGEPASATSNVPGDPDEEY